MVPKFLVLAVSCIFIVQINNGQAQDLGQDSNIITPPPAATVSQKELANATATKTVNTMLRHLRILMTNSVSASMLRYIATACRTVLTDETGQKNVQNLTDFIVNTLKDPNTLVTLKILRKRLVQLAASGRNSAIVLETAAESTKRILDEPQVLAATEGLIEGINCLLADMNEQKLREGIGRVAKLQKFATFLRPKGPEKIQTAVQKLRRTKSDAQVNYQSLEGDREVQLQTRSVEGWDDEERKWVNQKPRVKGSKNKKERDSFDERQDSI